MEHSAARHLIRPLDVVILALSIFVAVYTGVKLYSQKSVATLVTIESPRGTWVYPLDQDRLVEIQGKNGISIIRIKDSKVYFVESACPNKTCVQAAPISHQHEWLACLPNQVFISISGNKLDSDQVDIMAK